MYNAEYICKQLNLNLDDILNIYPYGSKIYGNNNENSDDDFIAVYKQSLLPSGAFKDNAISSPDFKIQVTCYSKGGFIDAINNYQINALECIFLPKNKIIQEKQKFSLNKFYIPDIIKNIIKTASASWYLGKLSYKNDDIEIAKNNLYHAVRIIDFGIQIIDNKRIVDYSKMNYFKEELIKDNNFNYQKYYATFIVMSDILKSRKK